MSNAAATMPGRTEVLSPSEPGRFFAFTVSFPGALSLLSLLMLALVYFSPFADLDYTWQIRTGEEILRTGSLRQPDTFSYTIAGQPVNDFEWLYEVGLAIFWQFLGYGGLRFLKVLLVASPLFVVAYLLRRQSIDRQGVLLTILLAVVVVSPAWNLRPLVFTTLGLLLVSGWLHDHCTGRKPLSWWLPLLMLLWSNIHPGVITGQALLAGAIGWEWLNRWVKLNRPLSREGCLRLTCIGGLGLAATFIAPDPIERMLYPFRPELVHPIMRVFVEMQPLYRFVFRPPYTAGLIYVMAAAVLMTVILRFRQYRLWEVALLAGLALLGNVAFRSASDWFLVMLALGVPHVKALRKQHGRHEQNEKSVFNSPLLRFQPGWLIAGFAVLAVISLVPPLAKQVPYWEPKEVPVAAVDWIEANQWHGNFFAPADTGSYLGWRLGERAKVYVDTRGFFFPPVLLEDCHYLPQLAPGWEARLERVLSYGTDYFLLETTGPRAEMWRQMQPIIKEPLYLDSHSVLLSTAQVQEAATVLRKQEQKKDVQTAEGGT